MIKDCIGFLGKIDKKNLRSQPTFHLELYFWSGFG